MHVAVALTCSGSRKKKYQSLIPVVQAHKVKLKKVIQQNTKTKSHSRRSGSHGQA